MNEKLQDAIPPGATFRHGLRTRFFEVDQHGQVHNAYFLVYAEQAITEFLKACDCGDLIVPGADGCIYVVARSQVDYLKAVGFDADLSLAVWVSRFGRSSLTFSVAVCESGGDAGIAALARVVWVYKDGKTGKSTALQPALGERLAGAIFEDKREPAP